MLPGIRNNTALLPDAQTVTDCLSEYSSINVKASMEQNDTDGGKQKPCPNGTLTTNF